MVALAIAVTAAALQPDARSTIGDRAQGLTRESRWKLVRTVALQFPTYHPQGLVKVGETMFLSSVEVKVATKRFDIAVDGYDRDTGQGIGHLFKIDNAGRLLGEVRLGETTAYHPGGIDFDDHAIWVPVAEYRPNSRSTIYRVDPSSLKATEVLRVADHIGAVVRDTDDGTLYGISWGSRRFYRWTLGADQRVTNALASSTMVNTAHYIDYQDCKYAGRHRMLCTGVAEIRPQPNAPLFRIGGLELVDLRDGRPLHQVPVLLWIRDGLDMTHNPTWFEATPSGLRGYFVPEDNRSTLYVYEVSSESSGASK